MNDMMNKLWIRMLVGASMTKNELQKLREEDEGLQIIVTIVLVAVGLLLVGILVKYAQEIVDVADSQVSGISETVSDLKSNVK